MSALWLLANGKTGLSSYAMHRARGVTHQPAWFLRHRIRVARQDRPPAQLSGQVEAAETFIGGTARAQSPSGVFR